jgi:hypothetical protein
MKPVTYICEKYPGLSIGSQKGREVKFRRGRFVADKDWQVKTIESNEWFGCFIFKARSHTAEPIAPSPQAIHTSAKRGDETKFQPPKEGDQTHISEAKNPEALAAVTPPPDTKEAFASKPTFKVSDTAKAILKKAGLTVPKAAAILDLADGDRLTVKMAEGIVDG